jgi:membrane protein
MKLRSETPYSDGIPWRVKTLWPAVRTLITIGGVDLAGSLAYFTILSFLPFLSLTILIFTIFTDQDTLHNHISYFMSIYFPSSIEFLNVAITPLFDSRPVVGTISVLTLIWGANGLLVATTRTINRVFHSRQRPLFRRTAIEISFGIAVLFLFLVTIALSQILRIATDVTPEQIGDSVLLSQMTSWLAKALLSIFPLAGTFMVFFTVYRVFPNRHVPWGDAAFGAIVASILFEEAKFLCFWLATSTGNQSLVYGPLTSVIVFLAWSHTAGMIFLFGACLTKESMSLRTGIDVENVDGLPLSRCPG